MMVDVRGVAVLWTGTVSAFKGTLGPDLAGLQFGSVEKWG
jgi:hypothetical protein